VERTQDSGSYGSSRSLLVVSLIGLILSAFGVKVLIDPSACSMTDSLLVR